ncbi:hypothetical protein ACGFWD_20835 [Streptomyces sp. NPDC048448]|uniref:hypothetical protein n=1 Tax=Streptomyces sp. NPDC048448 TaxID=3365554 RepID=UPI0037197111
MRVRQEEFFAPGELMRRKVDRDSPHGTVEAVTISGIPAGNHVERVGLLKIDGERAESDVRRRVADGDWHRIRSVVLEVQGIGGRLTTCSRTPDTASRTSRNRGRPAPARTG